VTAPAAKGRGVDTVVALHLDGSAGDLPLIRTPRMEPHATEN
jgi:hypothetical protein